MKVKSLPKSPNIYPNLSFIPKGRTEEDVSDTMVYYSFSVNRYLPGGYGGGSMQPFPALREPVLSFMNIRSFPIGKGYCLSMRMSFPFRLWRKPVGIKLPDISIRPSGVITFIISHIP